MFAVICKHGSELYTYLYQHELFEQKHLYNKEPGVKPEDRDVEV